MTRGVALLVFVAALSSGCTSTTSATEIPGQDPRAGQAITTAWAEIVGDLDAPGTTATSCHRGEPECLLAVVGEMEARLDRIGCAHTAPFAFTYLEMTRGVVEAVGDFEDSRLISMIDARFARQYFDAFDNWYAGNRDDVPAAWQVAFATADRRESSAALDLVLGMNAHISRDLAYIVAASGVAELAVEEPEDYRQVNEVIAQVKSPMLRAAADRFDPNLFLLDADLPSSESPDPLTLITNWRSFAFDLGVAVATAEDDAERNAAIAEIERTSAAAAAVLVAAEAESGSSEVLGALVMATGPDVFLTPEDRDAYCKGRLDAGA